MLSYPTFNTSEVLTLSQIGSTNDYAHQLIDEGKSIHGQFVLATVQTNGKGQKQNKWHSGVANEQLTGSLILHHAQSTPSSLFVLNMAVSLATYDTLKTYVADQQIAIKWSNDILVNQKKVAGLLIENILRGAYCTHSIIGIGINLNAKNFPDFLPDAASLYSVTGKNYVVQDVVHELLFNLNFRLQQATQNQAIIEEMYNANLYLRNTLTAFEMREILVYGMPTKVDSLGNLHIAINGQIQKFAFGEIKQILPGTN